MFLTSQVVTWEGELGEDFTALCEHYKVDLKALAKDLKAKAKDEPAKLEGETEGAAAKK